MYDQADSRFAVICTSYISTYSCNSIRITSLTLNHQKQIIQYSSCYKITSKQMSTFYELMTGYHMLLEDAEGSIRHSQNTYKVFLV